ncbi:hypothetical protein GOP47_0020259, partial [Adiantum capillus-veneris]
DAHTVDVRSLPLDSSQLPHLRPFSLPQTQKNSFALLHHSLLFLTQSPLPHSILRRVHPLTTHSHGERREGQLQAQAEGEEASLRRSHSVSSDRYRNSGSSLLLSLQAQGPQSASTHNAATLSLLRRIPINDNLSKPIPSSPGLHV